MPSIVLATHNKGKLAELKALLKDSRLEVLGLDAFPEIGDIPETGETFEDNALLKARTVSELTGMIAVADDSGLAVDALGGAPGVYSARYSDPGATPARNNAKLLEELDGVEPDRRTAQFVCVMAVVAPGGHELMARGEWQGRITRSPRGTGGFGYDPVFFDPQAGITAGEMEPAAKNERSHRGKALRALLEEWPAFLARAQGA